MKKNTLKLKLILSAMFLFGALFVTSTASATDVNSTYIRSMYYNHYGDLLVHFNGVPYRDKPCMDQWTNIERFETIEKRKRVAQMLLTSYLTGRKLDVRYYECEENQRHKLVSLAFTSP